MDIRTQAEKNKQKREMTRRRLAQRTEAEKRDARYDVEDRIGGTTLAGKLVTDAAFDDPAVAEMTAKHLEERAGHVVKPTLKVMVKVKKQPNYWRDR